MQEKSNIDKIDFGLLYRQQKTNSSFDSKDAMQWDKKANSMNEKIFQSTYIKDFISKIDTKNAKTLLDVGCGPGALSLSLARKFEDVYCLDFSSKMLEVVRQNAKDLNLNNVHTINESLENAWQNVPKCDILLASRCLEVEDLEFTIKELNKHGRKIYLSYKIGGSFLEDDIIEALELHVTPKPDYIYLINILYNLGINPKLEYIQGENCRFLSSSFEEFKQKIQWSKGGFLDESKDEKLLKLYENKYSNAAMIKPSLQWAFISYEV